MIKEFFILIMLFITLLLAKKIIKFHKSKVLNEFIKIIIIVIFGMLYIKI